MKKRKIINLCCLAMVSVMLFAGCSSGKDSGSVDKKEALKVWGMGDEIKYLSEVSEDFTKQTGIEVNVQAIPWSSAHDKLLTAVASKSGPDVLQLGTTWMPEFQAAGALTDMGPYIEKYPSLANDNFFEGSVKTNIYDNKNYGIPWAAETRVLFYRTDTLEKVGYSKAPKDWKELEDAAAKLAARGDDKYGISIDAKEQSLGFMFSRQNGSKLIDENNKALFNEKTFVDSIFYLNNFIQKGYSPKEDLGMDVTQTFSGEDPIIPMFISGPWMVKSVNETVKGIEGKWSTATLPAKENNTSSLGGSNLTIFEYSKNKDNSAKFIEFMTKSETQLKWLDKTNAMPTSKKAWENDKLKNDPKYKVFGDQMKNSQPMPLIPEFEEIAQSYLKHFEKIYLGGQDVQKEMDLFNKETQILLDKK